MHSDHETLQISADRTRINGTGRYSEKNRVACGTWIQDGIHYLSVWVDPVENGHTSENLLDRLFQQLAYGAQPKGMQPIAHGDLNVKELALQMFADFSHISLIARALMGEKFTPFRKAMVRVRSKARLLGTLESLFPKPGGASPVVRWVDGSDEFSLSIKASRK